MLLVITGPSGVGKTYLISELLLKFPDHFVSPQLVTTRQPRQNQQEVDRMSVSHEQFHAMRKSGDFIAADEFRSNWYGFPLAITQQQTQHVVINIWPALIPQFAKITDTVFVGLSVDVPHLPMLERRMLGRGDTPEIVTERMKQVEIDRASLAEHANLIGLHGKMFSVTGDDTLPLQVMPWIVQQAMTEDSALQKNS